MKYKDIKEMSQRDLVEHLKEEKLQLQKLKLSHAVSPIENPQKIKATRRTVAKYLTELNLRKNAEQSN